MATKSIKDRKAKLARDRRAERRQEIAAYAAAKARQAERDQQREIRQAYCQGQIATLQACL